MQKIKFVIKAGFHPGIQKFIGLVCFTVNGEDVEVVVEDGFADGHAAVKGTEAALADPNSGLSKHIESIVEEKSGAQVTSRIPVLVPVRSEEKH